MTGPAHTAGDIRGLVGIHSEKATEPLLGQSGVQGTYKRSGSHLENVELLYSVNSRRGLTKDVQERLIRQAH